MRGVRGLVALFSRRILSKVIGPYLVLVVVVALLATYVLTSLVTDSLEQKFRSELADAGRVANEAIVQLEADHLRVYRYMAFTEGVPETLAVGDVTQLRRILVPIHVNGRVDFVDVVAADSRPVLSLRLSARGSEPAREADPAMRDWAPLRRVLAGEADARGDKFAEVVNTAWGPMVYTAGPVKLDGRLVGAIAIGTPLEKAVERMAQESAAGVTLYDADGAALATSLRVPLPTLALAADERPATMGPAAEVLLRTVEVGASRYQELLGTMEVRGQPALGLGVSQSISLILERGSLTRSLVIAGFALTMAVILGIGYFLAKQLTRPILLLVEACRAVMAGDLSREVPVVNRDETGVLTVAFNQAIRGLRERDRARDAFARYVSPDLYEAIQQGELKLGGEEREITIVLSDIRGFTTLAEQMAPEALVHFLNEYFESQVAAIQRHGGTVDKFMGDAILAKFGAPVHHADHAERAVRAMVDMRAALADFNGRRLARGLAPIRIGVGASTGPAVAGNIGSTARMEYTIIGDTVNTAQRIEEMTKELGGDLLISDTTYARARDLVEVGEPTRIQLRGRSAETLIYPVLRLRVAGDPLPTGEVAAASA